MCDVVNVLAGSLDVHVSRIPISLSGHALGRPMRPDPKFGIAKPFRALVIGYQRFPSRLKRPGPYRPFCRQWFTRNRRVRTRSHTTTEHTHDHHGPDKVFEIGVQEMAFQRPRDFVPGQWAGSFVPLFQINGRLIVVSRAYNHDRIGESPYFV